MEEACENYLINYWQETGTIDLYDQEEHQLEQQLDKHCNSTLESYSVYMFQLAIAGRIVRVSKELSWDATKASLQEMYVQALSTIHILPFPIMDFDLDMGMAKWSVPFTQFLVDGLYDTWSSITPLSLRNYYEDHTYNYYEDYDDLATTNSHDEYSTTTKYFEDY